MKNKMLTAALAASALLVAATTYVQADEGMWLFTNPPTQQLKAKYNFEPTPQWLHHVRRSAVRFNAGGSASFVSADGLVMTNHHVGRGQLQRHSTPERDLLETGFLAKTRDEEIKCKDLELNTLWEIEDITQKVKGAATPDMSKADANTARRKMTTRIEKECEDETGMDCQVVTLYQGGQYHLYRYKRFTDVRLVMAPEQKIAFFGGDNDNFEYPRFCLDMCFFRVYENDKPYNPEYHLKWSKTGVREGDLTFVVGHPGSTQRLNTVADLTFMRDNSLPAILSYLWRREVQLQTFSARNDEFARIAKGNVFGVQNGRKALTGRLNGLYNPSIMNGKKSEERKLRAIVDANPDYNAQWGDAWDQIAQAQEEYKEYFDRHQMRVGSQLFGIARNLVRLAEEKQKPNEERLREYNDAALDRLYMRLFSPAPIYDDLEVNSLESSLSFAAEQFGYDDPQVQLALAGKSPRQRAEELVNGTKLKDVDVRKKLAEAGTSEIAASNDPMIRLAAALDPEARKLRKRYEDGVEATERDAYAKIAAARFAVFGENVYPDATFTLRLAYGPVTGYRENNEFVKPLTNFAGLYERYEQRKGQDGFELDQRWLDRKDKLDLTVPFNFVNSADIIGGNSGSPVIDTKGEVVGLIFDGNLHSLVFDIGYTDQQARSVAVDSRGMIEALRKIYDAGFLADELLRD